MGGIDMNVTNVDFKKVARVKENMKMVKRGVYEVEYTQFMNDISDRFGREFKDAGLSDKELMWQFRLLYLTELNKQPLRMRSAWDWRINNLDKMVDDALETYDRYASWCNEMNMKPLEYYVFLEQICLVALCDVSIIKVNGVPQEIFVNMVGFEKGSK